MFSFLQAKTNRHLKDIYIIFNVHLFTVSLKHKLTIAQSFLINYYMSS